MTKKEARVLYKSKRSLLTQLEIEDKSVKIANNLLQLPIWNLVYYHLFLTIEGLKEIDTSFILHILSGKDKEIIVSKSDFQTLNMTHFLLTDNTKIQVNTYGIPEPITGIEVCDSQIEVVFVPLLAFDEIGNRVGYGKGFYDLFLSKCNPETIKIGLSFFSAEAKIEDYSTTDIPLDYCVTPSEIYKF
jgi:5-formyltetrahydrofolate cyclo-ligase